MITLTTAKKLKTVGIQWHPKNDDRFIVPDRGLDDQLFVLNNMTIQYEILQGHPAITFNGATEWALDYIFQIETVWMPRESQLRELLWHKLLSQSDQANFTLSRKPAGYLCTIKTAADNSAHTFEADTASEAYAEALLHLIL